MHYGVGHDKGGHSGRYPWGSGKFRRSTNIVRLSEKRDRIVSSNEKLNNRINKAQATVARKIGNTAKYQKRASKYGVKLAKGNTSERVIKNYAKANKKLNKAIAKASKGTKIVVKSKKKIMRNEQYLDIIDKRISELRDSPEVQLGKNFIEQRKNKAV